MTRQVSLWTWLLLLGLGVAGITALPVTAQMPDVIYPVDNSGTQFRVYTDPNTNETIQLGEFSGMVPVSCFGPGKLLQIVTDRGATGDESLCAVWLVAACGVLERSNACKMDCRGRVLGQSFLLCSHSRRAEVHVRFASSPSFESAGRGCWIFTWRLRAVSRPTERNPPPPGRPS